MVNRARRLRVGITFAALAAAAVAVGAQDAPPAAPPGPAAEASPPAPSPPPPAAASLLDRASCRPLVPPRVTAAGRAVGGGGAVELRQSLAVEVDGLAAVVEQQACLRALLGPAGTGLVLYLDGRALGGVEPVGMPDPESSRLVFDLRRTEGSRDAWAHVLGSPTFGARTVPVSVGFEGRYALPSSATVALRPLPRGPFVFWLLLFAGLAWGFHALAVKSEILRDPAPDPGPDKRRPYSLSRAQAAWWCFVILASYLFLGVVTRDFTNTLSATAVVLLGLASGTVLGAAMVDASKDTAEARAAGVAAIAEVEGEMKDLEAQAVTARKPAEAAALQASAAERRSELARLRQESVHFVLDILSDSRGVSFARFQNAAWTLVVGLVFAVQVYRELAMPELGNTLLGLMGISSGTYLGMKIPEDARPRR